MKVEVDLTEYGVKAPKWYDPINPHVINASGGSGGGNDVELTFAEYEALSEEEKMNGNNYFITDIGNPKSLTSKVLFDGDITGTGDFSITDAVSNYDYLIFYAYPYWNNTSTKDGKSVIFDVKDYLQNYNGMVIANESSTDDNHGYRMRIITTSNPLKLNCNLLYIKSGYTQNRLQVKIVGYRYERVVVPNQMVNYSTVEARIGTWIDGKPLYQKTISKSYDELTTYNTRKGFSLDIANTILHNVEAYAYSPTYGTCFLGCKNYTSDISYSDYMECNMYYNIVVVEHSEGLSRLDENVYRPSLTTTFQYTKTTD